MTGELCELGTWKGLQNAPETCRCVHQITFYRTWVGGARCACCFGEIPVVESSRAEAERTFRAVEKMLRKQGKDA